MNRDSIDHYAASLNNANLHNPIPSHPFQNEALASANHHICWIMLSHSCELERCSLCCQGSSGLKRWLSVPGGSGTGLRPLPVRQAPSLGFPWCAPCHQLTPRSLVRVNTEVKINCVINRGGQCYIGDGWRSGGKRRYDMLMVFGWFIIPCLVSKGSNINSLCLVCRLTFCKLQFM